MIHATVARSNNVRIHALISGEKGFLSHTPGNGKFRFFVLNEDVLPLLSLGDPVHFIANDTAFSGEIARIETGTRAAIQISIRSHSPCESKSLNLK